MIFNLGLGYAIVECFRSHSPGASEIAISSRLGLALSLVKDAPVVTFS